MRLLIALILCASYFVKDGVLASWSWDESIHHASIEHEHPEDQSHEDDHDHRGDDCCLSSHAPLLISGASLTLPQPFIVRATHAPYFQTYLPWTLAPPLRPPIA
jgi:ABC-type nickel/cobalt efflux system permease component RcnA